MALTLNTNIDSLTAQNNLNGSQALLSQSLTRLSSGLRINSAADDAAGLAISQQFTTQVNGTNQAINNANDAVSEAQTAGGALTTIVNNLQSIRTLAVEAANGSNSASDRQALNEQVQQQIAEVTQIASQTNFNGSSVLNGTSGTTTFQVGANVGDTISINLAQGVQANQIGQVASQTKTVGSAALLGGLTIAVGTSAAVTIGASANYATSSPGQSSTSAYAKAATINAADISGLTATATTTATDSTGFSAVSAGTGAAGTYDLSINGVNIYSGTDDVAAGSTLTGQNVVNQINLYSSQDGNVTASLSSTGVVSLTAADGSNITVKRRSHQLWFGDLVRQHQHRHRQFLNGHRRPRGARCDRGQCDAGQQHVGECERPHRQRGECHDSGGRCRSVDGQCLPKSVGRHSEPVHGGSQQPDIHRAEPDAVSQHDSGCELRPGNGQLDPGSGAGTGGYLGVVAGQPRAAADSQAFAVTVDILQ
jgi:flagellin-like hook-associated protein FlgL